MPVVLASPSDFALEDEVVTADEDEAAVVEMMEALLLLVWR